MCQEICVYPVPDSNTNPKNEAELIVYSCSKTGRYDYFANQEKTIAKKALNLINLYQLGIPVPSFIYLDYSIYAEYQNDQDFASQLLDRLAKEKALNNQIAIRSCGEEEDSPLQSWAGMSYTELYVEKNNIKNLQYAIDRCYRSFAWTKKPSATRGEISPESSDQKVGLVVQQMIAPKISGVLFTCQPQNPERNEYRIEYCKGRGDKLTNSESTGKTIILDKAGEPVEQDKTFSINKDHLQKIFEFARKLEKKFGQPQDIEFVISKSNVLYFLQSRPVTAYSYSPEVALSRERKKLSSTLTNCQKRFGMLDPILSSSNISELFPKATPLTFSIFRFVFAGTKRKPGAINLGRKWLGYAQINGYERENLFMSVGNQARVNLAIDALTFRIRGIAKKAYLNAVVKMYISEIEKQTNKANYPEIHLYNQLPSIDDCKKYYGYLGSYYFKLYEKFFANLESKLIPELLSKLKTILRNNDQFYNNESKVDLAKLKLPELVRKLTSHVEYLRTELGRWYVSYTRIGFLYAALTRKEIDRCLSRFPSLRKHLLQFFPENEVSPEFLFDILMSLEPTSPQFKAACMIGHERRVQLGELSFDQYVANFAHLGSLDFMEPRFAELDESTIRTLIETTERSSNNIVREKVQDYYRESIAPKVNTDARKFHEYACTFLNVREVLKNELLRNLFIIKKVVEEIKKHLGINDLIYYLQYDRLLAASVNRNEQTVQREAMQNKAYFNTCDLIEVEKVILNSNRDSIKIRKVRIPNQQKSMVRLRGTTIHYGSAEGICLVARDNNEFYQKLILYRKRGIENIIGVFHKLDFSYRNLTELVGFVTEFGGLLAHAATVAREFNIPYISSVNIREFRDGSKILLDTTANEVIIHPE